MNTIWHTSLWQLILCFSPITFLSSQVIHGVITDETDQPLPYTSIYITNTSTGTVSNENGEYRLTLTAGTYEITYRFVGYESQTEKVYLEANREHELDIQLQPQSTELAEITITADAEDPAYAIIRKAIEKRSYYNRGMPSYQCEVYVKGVQRVDDIPERILGMDVGDLDGYLDSTRSGILYLSETVSTLYIDGQDRKEVVTSSKISGDPQGYSFNSAKEMEMNFYDNTIDLHRQIISPIADNALNYYNYKLEGYYKDKNGYIVNKIAVLPKRSNDPVFAGWIYITENLYNLHSLSLHASPEATQIFFIDTLSFNQVYIPINESDHWARFSNAISFSAKIFGASLKGEFTAMYSNYQSTSEPNKNLFNQYEYVILPESNEQDSQYWETTRPVPLTAEESNDYTKKDSINEVRTAPTYLDSIDRINNKFSFGDLLGSYEHQNRNSKLYWNIESPISHLNFSTVQGLHTTIAIKGRKYFDEKETTRILWGGSINYGFSEKKWRQTAYLAYRPTRLKNTESRIQIGQEAIQINPQNPISTTYNTLYGLFFKRNHAKYLDLKYATLSHRFEPANGLLLWSDLAYEERSQLFNNTDYSFAYRDRQDRYTTNDHVGRTEPYQVNTHQALTFGTNLRIRLKQKYHLRPDSRFDLGHTGPTFLVSYKGAYKAINTDVSYHKLAASIYDTWFAGVGGRMMWYVNGGIFFNQENMNLRDYRHFNTSEIFVMSEQNYDATFLQLPYYTYSTNTRYIQAHAEHHFDGFLLDKLPIFKKLSWHLVAGAKYLKVPEQAGYAEFHLGLDNVGYKLFRIFRIDAVVSVSDQDPRWGARLSIGF